MNLNVPAENIPEEIIVDLKGLEIGTSIKISSIKLPENVDPTIMGRDFVIATVAAPTVMKEPEKPAEGEAVKEQKGTEGTEGAPAVAGAEGANLLKAKKVMQLKKMIKQKIKLQKKNSLKRNN